MTSCRSCASCERELSAVRLDLISALGQAQDLIAERDQYRDALEQIVNAAYYVHRGQIARAALGRERDG